MNNKKILLIAPNAFGLEEPLSYPPLGLLYIASSMANHWQPTVKVYTDDRFYDFEYDYYGISVHSISTYKEAKRLVNLIREYNKEAEIYLGGAGSRLFQKDTPIRNVFLFNGEGELFFGKHQSVRNLDDISFPARHLLPREHITYTGSVHHATEPSTTIIATRGCVYNCSFCDRVTMGRKFRKRSVKNVIDEILEVQKEYGINWFRFVDDCLTLDKAWFTDLCVALGNIGIKWTCLSRADLLNKEILELMKDSGCQEIFFGFESGSQKILDLMNKNIKVEKNEEAIRLCKEAGITCCAYMLFGFPGEDEETVNETLDFLERANPDKSRISTFVPIPDTDVWDNSSKYNVRVKDNFEDFWYFDNKKLGLEYLYSTEKEMERLRDIITSYYDKKFKENWTNDGSNRNTVSRSRVA